MNIGPVHLISFNSEYFYSVQYGWEQIVRQYQWLEHDLRVCIVLYTHLLFCVTNVLLYLVIFVPRMGPRAVMCPDSFVNCDTV